MKYNRKRKRLWRKKKWYKYTWKLNCPECGTPFRYGISLKRRESGIEQVAPYIGREDDTSEHQTCKVCGLRDKFDYNVDGRTWETVVPKHYRGNVVCLGCFDDFAKEKGIGYQLRGPLYFAGDAMNYKWPNVAGRYSGYDGRFSDEETKPGPDLSGELGGGGAWTRN